MPAEASGRRGQRFALRRREASVRKLLKIAAGFALGIAAAVVISARRHPAGDAEPGPDAAGTASG
jgi:hypothetical protein